MASMDIFKSDAFSTFSMLQAMENLPFQPQRISSMGLFTDVPVKTEKVGIEMRDAKLRVIKTSERGGPIAQRGNEKRNIRDFRTSRIVEGDRINASEVAGIRAFGSESELMAVMTEVASRLDGPTGILRDIELTWERHALGAILGEVVDADNTVIYNWFDEFGITEPAAIDFNLDAASPTMGDLRVKFNEVIRTMRDNSGGSWIQGQTRVYGFCGRDYWDAFTQHPEVRESYIRAQDAAQQLRQANAPYGQFNFGGITIEEYEGTVSGTIEGDVSVGIAADEIRFFPVGTPGIFQRIFSPGESMEFVNTPGRPVYPMLIPDRDRNAFVDIEAYSYPLMLCTRPGMLLKGTA